MDSKYNKTLVKRSRELRSDMTKEETKLWYKFLKTLPITIKRQHVIGNYIVDFYCAGARLVIEIDGSQHYEEEGERKDALRDAKLKSLGYNVVRYTNGQINEEFRNVCEDIYYKIFSE